MFGTELLSWKELPTSEIIPEFLAWRLPVRGIRPLESLQIRIEEFDTCPKWLREETSHVTLSIDRGWNPDTIAGTISPYGAKYLDIPGICNVIRTCPNLRRLSLTDRQITQEIIDECLSRAPMELDILGYEGKELCMSREFDLKGSFFVILNNFNGLNVSNPCNKKLIHSSSSVTIVSGWLKANDITEMLDLNIDGKVACANVDFDSRELEKLALIIGQRSDDQRITTTKFPDLKSLLRYLVNTRATIQESKRWPPKFEWSNENLLSIMRWAMEKL